MSRLPLTVIGGYLGAGKTTLINRLLSGDHGRRLMVMVNDFGAVNIDAALLSSVSGDTLELTNGCVCCTMGADLFMAVGDVLDRPERPDHLIIEASGIADPARIADVARNEPDLSYAGILTVVDGLNFEQLLNDDQIAPQLQAQIDVADLIHVTKLDVVPAALDGLLGAAPRIRADVAMQAIVGLGQPDLPELAHGHTHFTRWVGAADTPMTQDELTAKLAARPAGLYRVKGFVAAPGGRWLVQVVGRSIEISPASPEGPCQIVGIGPDGAVTGDQIEAWWQIPV